MSWGLFGQIVLLIIIFAIIKNLDEMPARHVLHKM